MRERGGHHGLLNLRQAGRDDGVALVSVALILAALLLTVAGVHALSSRFARDGEPIPAIGFAHQRGDCGATFHVVSVEPPTPAGSLQVLAADASTYVIRFADRLAFDEP
ncbi:MAG TPA: hypothetical protein VM582_02340, partial [Candidatus Thermoplasmatota archaeon]|nr:hypothetical protein [Candidatus Thermoplasmatota archaeon]